MGAEKESGSDEPGNAGVPPPCDVSRPVVAVEESSPLAAKLAKLAENLSAGRALAQKELSDGAPTAPALITSGSLFEAKAYLANVEPLNEEEPITIEMQRIRIAEELRAQYIVLGQVQGKAGSGRVLVHLIRLPDQAHLWVTRVENPDYGDAVRTQKEIARRTVRDLAVKLTRSGG